MARPRTSTERSRATRLRAKLSGGAKLSKRDQAWFDAYTRAVSAPRPHTATERSRAARIRAKLRAGKAISIGDVRFLKRYEGVEERLYRVGGSARKDAGAILKALTDWSGMNVADARVEWQRKPRAGLPGTAYAQATSVDGASFDMDPEDRAPGDRFEVSDVPDLPSETGRSMSTRVLVQTAEQERVWYSVTELTPRWKAAAVRIANAIKSIVNDYAVLAIWGWSVFVRPPRIEAERPHRSRSWQDEHDVFA